MAPVASPPPEQINKMRSWVTTKERVAGAEAAVVKEVTDGHDRSAMEIYEVSFSCLVKSYEE